MVAVGLTELIAPRHPAIRPTRSAGDLKGNRTVLPLSKSCNRALRGMAGRASLQRLGVFSLDELALHGAKEVQISVSIVLGGQDRMMQNSDDAFIWYILTFTARLSHSYYQYFGSGPIDGYCVTAQLALSELSVCYSHSRPCPLSQHQVVDGYENVSTAHLCLVAGYPARIGCTGLPWKVKA